ncbi:hypothetical protein ABK040_003945 [Willaertia magna]
MLTNDLPEQYIQEKLDIHYDDSSDEEEADDNYDVKQQFELFYNNKNPNITNNKKELSYSFLLHATGLAFTHSKQVNYNYYKLKKQYLKQTCPLNNVESIVRNAFWNTTYDVVCHIVKNYYCVNFDENTVFFSVEEESELQNLLFQLNFNSKLLRSDFVEQYTEKLCEIIERKNWDSSQCSCSDLPKETTDGVTLGIIDELLKAKLVDEKDRKIKCLRVDTYRSLDTAQYSCRLGKAIMKLRKARKGNVVWNVLGPSFAAEYINQILPTEKTTDSTSSELWVFAERYPEIKRLFQIGPNRLRYEVKYLISQFFPTCLERTVEDNLQERKILDKSFTFISHNVVSFLANIRLSNRSEGRLIKNYERSYLLEQLLEEFKEIKNLTQWNFKNHNSTVVVTKSITKSKKRHRLGRNESVEGNSTTYDNVLSKVTSLLNYFTTHHPNLNLTDRDVAKWIREILNGTPLSIIETGCECKLKDSEKSIIIQLISELTYLLFGCEFIRNPASFPVNQMILDLVIEGKLLFGSAFHKMPMAPKKSVRHARKLHGFYNPYMPYRYEYPGNTGNKVKIEAEVFRMCTAEAALLGEWLNLKNFRGTLKVSTEPLYNEFDLNELFTFIKEKSKSWFENNNLFEMKDNFLIKKNLSETPSSVLLRENNNNEKNDVLSVILEDFQKHNTKIHRNTIRNKISDICGYHILKLQEINNVLTNDYKQSLKSCFANFTSFWYVMNQSSKDKVKNLLITEKNNWCTFFDIVDNLTVDKVRNLVEALDNLFKDFKDIEDLFKRKERSEWNVKNYQQRLCKENNWFDVREINVFMNYCGFVEEQRSYHENGGIVIVWKNKSKRIAKYFRGESVMLDENGNIKNAHKINEFRSVILQKENSKVDL